MLLFHLLDDNVRNIYVDYVRVSIIIHVSGEVYNARVLAVPAEGRNLRT